MELLFNFRFSTAVTIDQLKSRVEAVLKHHMLDYELFWKLSGQPFLTPAGRCLWGNIVAEDEQWIDEVNWWYFEKPRQPGPRLQQELDAG